MTKLKTNLHNKSITEHPDVQRLIKKTVLLQAKNKRLKQALSNVELHAGSNLVQGIARKGLKEAQ